MARLIACFALLVGCAAAVTLQQLSPDDLINQSTAIVRCRVAGSYVALTAGELYTHYRVQVSTRLKGTALDVTEVVFPGGTLGNMRQTIPGMPRLQEGREYVLYLWTSKTSGLTFVTGFQQGIFNVATDPDGTAVLQRAAMSEMILDAHGKPVSDVSTRVRLQDMMNRVAALTRGAGR